MVFPILVRWHLYIELGPSWFSSYRSCEVMMLLVWIICWSNSRGADDCRCHDCLWCYCDEKISICNKSMYSKISNISHTKFQNFSVSRLGFKLICAIYWSQVLSGKWRCSWSSADRQCSLVTSEWSTIKLPTKASLILETWRYCWEYSILALLTHWPLRYLNVNLCKWFVS